MEFTREELIEHLRQRIVCRQNTIDSDHIEEGYRHYLKLELRSAEIALDALLAEPGAWRCDSGTIPHLRAVTCTKLVADSWKARGMETSALYELPSLHKAAKED